MTRNLKINIFKWLKTREDVLKSHSVKEDKSQSKERVSRFDNVPNWASRNEIYGHWNRKPYGKKKHMGRINSTLNTNKENINEVEVWIGKLPRIEHTHREKKYWEETNCRFRYLHY